MPLIHYTPYSIQREEPRILFKQILKPFNLGFKYPIKLLGRFIDDQAVLQHTGTVNDSLDRAIIGTDLIENRLNTLQIPDINAKVSRRDSGLLELFKSY